MDLCRFDLNLLVVFDAVLRERSVARASRHLNVTQSAVSHALARLRLLLEDELFVRDATGVRPTARAIALAEPVAQALDVLRRNLAPAQFDPAAARGSFTIAASDYALAVLLPPLIEDLGRHAPLLHVQIFPIGRLDLAAQLESGRVDIAISWFETLPPRLHRLPVAEDREALIVPRGHPFARQTPTLQQVLDAPHIAVDLTGLNEAGETGFVDERGLRRRTRIERLPPEHAVPVSAERRRPSLTVPSYLVVPHMVIVSGMIATLPLRLAQQAARQYPIEVLAPPYPSPPIRLDAVWHDVNDAHAQHAWARGLLQQAASGLPDLPP